MKITPEHFEYMKSQAEAHLEKCPDAVEMYETGKFERSDRVRDLQERFCFDLLHGSGLTPWVCENIYPYANDDHIFTALKRIAPTVTRRY